MKKISLHTFKHTLKDIHKHTQNRKLCFVLGAGASFKSGIPTGGHLAQKWYKEIKERYAADEITEWINKIKIDENDLSSHYGDIYRKRFENDKTSGYEFLIQAMKDAKPTFGHFVLAQILTKTPESCVVTTNFDSLIESSIYQYTNKTPLVCGHESLSGYARPSTIHPLIVKIHRDLLLAPMSDPDEIKRLNNGWKEPLDSIFSSHIPIVVGYGGNDGSLMEYFETMNKPSNLFWCGLKGNQPTKRITNLVQKTDGSYVEIEGFDEMMHELLQVFDEIKPVKEELEAITKSRLDAMDKQVTDLNNKTTPAITNAATSTKELSAFEYANKAEDEPNYDKRKAIYLEALEKYPNTAWLWNYFTHFLQWVKKDYGNLNEYYLKALAIDPEHVNNNANYAIYLNNIKKDYEFAEKYYLKALSIDPENANVNGNYASYLHTIKKDYELAEKCYLKALALDPESANKNGNYAQLLLVTNRAKEASSYIEKAFTFNNNEESGLLLELWFYRYAHYPEWLNQAEEEIEKLLQAGVQSIGWNLKDNIKVAIANGHPNPQKLQALADRITKPQTN